MEVNQDLERMKLRQGQHPSILGDAWLVSEIHVDRVMMILRPQSALQLLYRWLKHWHSLELCLVSVVARSPLGHIARSDNLMAHNDRNSNYS